MAIVVRLDVVMAQRKISLNALSSEVGISLTNLSLLKNGHVRGVRFNTLSAICKALDCQPGDFLEYMEDSENLKRAPPRAVPSLPCCLCCLPPPVAPRKTTRKSMPYRIQFERSCALRSTRVDDRRW